MEMTVKEDNVSVEWQCRFWLAEGGGGGTRSRSSASKRFSRRQACLSNLGEGGAIISRHPPFLDRGNPCARQQTTVQNNSAVLF